MVTVLSLSNYPDLSEKVYEVIKEQILAAHLAPGTVLHVVELARRLGVSRTPVSDALNRLSAEGFVEDLPRKGYAVSRLEARDFVQLLDARLILELGAVERGIGLVEPEEIAALRRVVEQMEQLVDAEVNGADYARFLKVDSEFHLLVVGTARNPHLADMYRRLYLRSHAASMHLGALVGYRPTSVVVKEHKQTVEAFAARDLPALKAIIAEHIKRVAEWYTEAEGRHEA